MIASALGAAFLGVLQGLTEFLPVSSSGHLVLFQQFMEIAGDEVLFDLVLHVGTLLPVLWFYRDRVAVLLTDPIQGTGPFLERHGVKLWTLLIAASVPTAIIGLTLEDVFEALFSTPSALTVTFAITATLMLATKFAPAPHRGLTIPLAIVLGIVQGFAITPGISRSGSTIAIALFLGVDREEAARFSFLMSVPAITGAVLKKSLDADLTAFDPVAMAIGFTAALVSGYAALVLLVELVKRGGLHWFAIWCYAAAAFAGYVAFAM
jgi:undecaprenyl-diphosphatase